LSTLCYSFRLCKLLFLCRGLLRLNWRGLWLVKGRRDPLARGELILLGFASSIHGDVSEASELGSQKRSAKANSGDLWPNNRIHRILVVCALKVGARRHLARKSPIYTTSCRRAWHEPHPSFSFPSFFYIRIERSENQKTVQSSYEAQLLLLYTHSFTMSGMHSHDGVHFHASHGHSHDLPAADHGHTHEILDGPGSYMGREMPIMEDRDWSERAFTVGIGGYVVPICPFPLDAFIPRGLAAGWSRAVNSTASTAFTTFLRKCLLSSCLKSVSQFPLLTTMQSCRLWQDSVNVSAVPRTPREILHRSRDERHLHPRRCRIPHKTQSTPSKTNPCNRNRRLPSRCRSRRHFRQPCCTGRPASRIHLRYPPDRVRRRQSSGELLQRTG